MTAQEKNLISARRRRFWRWVSLNVLLLGVVGLLSLTYPVQEMSRRLDDFYFRLRGNQTTSQQVALVLIDDASLSRYGRWPWRRALLARLVRAVSGQHPRAVGLDVLLSEPSDEKDDRELAAAFKAAGNVVLPTRIDTAPDGPKWLGPLPIFAHSVAGVGHAQVRLGPDGICRQVPVAEMSASGLLPAFAIEIVRASNKSESNPAMRERFDVLREQRTVGGERLLPEFLTIDYRGEVVSGRANPPFAVISAADLLDGRGGAALRNKAVLIGVAAEGIPDRFATPVSDRLLMPGVEVNANLVDGLLSGRHLQPLDPEVEVLVLFGASLILTWLLLHWSGWRGLAVLATLAVAGYFAGYLLFAYASRQVAYGPFVCLAVLVAPLAQLENLVMIDRGLTRSLHQLQEVLGKSFGGDSGLRAATAGAPALAGGDLHWKVATVNSLEAELGSLYAFDETLLKSMQEALAVFAADGRPLYKNPRWEELATKLGWRAAPTLREFLASVGKPDWAADCDGLADSELPLEAELLNDKGLWQVRVIRLPSASRDGRGPLMVVMADYTDRLERDRARAEALGFVTHELRTPLVSIQGFAEFLLRYPENSGSGQAAETIFRESKRLVAMINTYLDVLRLESGARPLKNEVVDIPEMLGHLERVMQPLAQSADMTVKVETLPAPAPLRGDSALIAGALLNLLSNAVKYGSRGSEVKLKTLNSVDQVVFEVWNHGPVIPPEDLARLFEPFYRRSEQQAAVAGWGLGLAFVKRIAGGHGGKVEASSDLATGTCFRIVLPAAPAVSREMES